MEKLAKNRNDIVNDPPRDYDFFKWQSYYSFHDTADNGYRESVCSLCAFLSSELRMYKKTVYKNIKYWWRPLFVRSILCFQTTLLLLTSLYLQPVTVLWKFLKKSNMGTEEKQNTVGTFSFL